MNERRLDSAWLALPLSARGLLRELAAIVDDDGEIETSLVIGADARAIGDELARLLCAFRNEYVRVRRDVAQLLERGLISMDGSRIRLQTRDRAVAPIIDVVPKSTSAIRMQRHRARQATSQCDAVDPSHVTPAAVTSDAGDASHVTRALSLDQKKLNLTNEREGARDARAVTRWLPRDAPFCERAREIAAAIGVREPDLVWRAFVAHHAEKKLSVDWDRLWEMWVVREKKFDDPRPTSPRPLSSTKGAVDFNAPWLRAAEGSS